MFESAEQRAEKKRAREAEEARAERARKALLAESDAVRARRAGAMGPVSAATEAKRAGQEFFETQLEVGGSVGTSAWGTATETRRVTSSADTLAEIEALGWRLEHVSHVFVVTGETSSNRFLTSGEATAVNGTMVGVYLFRNDRTRPTDDSVTAN